MELWQAIVLGVIQGLAEFLPIYSSGHLLLVQELMGLDFSQDEEIAFDVALHAGTLVALFAYFRSDLLALGRAFVRSLRTRSAREPEERLSWLILLGTLPAIGAYLLFSDTIRSMEDRPLLIASMLIGVSFIFIIAERFRGTRAVEDVRWTHALAIGCAQAAALIPGTSRSGATISMGMLLGFERAAAARFSFLLSAPVITAALVLSLPDLARSGAASNEFLAATIIGFAAAAISGYVAVAALLRFLGGHSLAWFAAYRIPVGILFLAYFMDR